MRWIHHALCVVAAMFVAIESSGCCCSCGGGDGIRSLLPPDGFNVNDGGNPVEPDKPALDPAVAEELKTAGEHAQKALGLKGYGKTRSAALRKDGLNWYVTGTVDDLAGGNPDYQVWFEVKRIGDRQIWNVKTVTVDGKVVYP